MPRVKSKPSKTAIKPLENAVQYHFVIEVINNAEGQTIIAELVQKLVEYRQNKSYIQGWIAPNK